MKSYVRINPYFRDFLHEIGLSSADQFLNLRAIVVSGHPDRHVGRLELENGESVVAAFLKREHRVPWKDRLSSAMAGFGLVSKSAREAAVLQSLQEVGIGCPQWMAFGEDGWGRAFLLVRELPGALDLRVYLRLLDSGATERSEFFRRLGQTIARIHSLGFEHSDLYAKHVLVDPAKSKLIFLDWQRSRRWRRLSWRRRQKDLAALDATLAEDLASPRDRLTLLQAYLHSSHSLARNHRLAQAIEDIRGRASRLLTRRHIRDQRHPPLPAGRQNLIWLAGESLCVTTEFLDMVDGRVPEWLVSAGSFADSTLAVSRAIYSLPGRVSAVLTRRRNRQILQWLGHLVRGRRLVSPELAHAGLLFRLQRHGIRTPRLLAVGQHYSAPWQIDSFLLTEELGEFPGLIEWLQRAGHDLGERRALIRKAGATLRALHAAGYSVSKLQPGTLDKVFVVQPGSEGSPQLVLADSERLLGERRGVSPACDVKAMWVFLQPALANRADGLRFLLAYLRLKRLTPSVKRMARSLLGDRPRRLPVDSQARSRKPTTEPRFAQ